MDINQLNLLPDDILINEIFPTLSTDNLIKLCQVNARFRRLCQSESTNRRLFNAKIVEYLNMKDGLVQAASKGDTAVVLNLLEMDTDEDVGDEYVAMMEAIKNGHIDIVDLFLDHGIDKYIDTAYHWALMKAVETKHIDIVKLLLDKAENVDTGFSPYDSPVNEAVKNGDYEMLKLLLDSPKILVKHGVYTALPTSIDRADYQAVDLLLQVNDLNPEIISNNFAEVIRIYKNTLNPKYYKYTSISEQRVQAYKTNMPKIFSRILSDPKIDIQNVQKSIVSLIEIMEKYNRTDLLKQLLNEPKIKGNIEASVLKHYNDKYNLQLLPPSTFFSRLFGY